MGRGDEAWVGAEFEEGSKRKCETCAHNSFEHLTGPISMDGLSEDPTDEEWKAFWDIPTPCRFCNCGYPEIVNQYMTVHHDCPKPCGCTDFAGR